MLAPHRILPTEEEICLYSEINDAHWKRLELGELTRDEVRVGRFEVFFDTIVLCTLTGFVILLARDGSFVTENGMHLVIYSFAKYYGKSAAYLITVSVVLFALATVVCWGYYGKACLSYLGNSKIFSRGYDILYCIITAIGAVMTESAVWELSDITVALMTVLNLSAVIWLRREIHEETEAAGLCPPRIR